MKLPVRLPDRAPIFGGSRVESKCEFALLSLSRAVHSATLAAGVEATIEGSTVASNQSAAHSPSDESARSAKHVQRPTAVPDSSDMQQNVPGGHPARLSEQGTTANGRSVNASQATMLLGLQRSAGNQAVQRMLGSGDGGAAVQRDPEAAAVAQPGAAPTPAPGVGATAQPGTKSAELTITGVFNDVPGESRTKTKPATEKDALWFDPLRTKSTAPQVAESTVAHGLVTGGEQQIESFAAPVTDTVKPVGRGSIQSQLKYTSKKDQSYNVVVSGVTGAQKPQASRAAKAFVKERIEHFGDVDEISKQAGQHLAATYPGATVEVSIASSAVKDMGHDTIYYKLRGNGKSAILLDVQVVPVAEKQTVSGGSKTTISGKESESSRNSSSESASSTSTSSSSGSTQSSSSSTELTEIAYNEAVVQTLDDYVNKVTTVHKEVASNLSEIVTDDKDFHSKEITKETKPKQVTITDYTKKIEKGAKDKSNWADKIKKGVKVAKKVTSIPYIDKIPGVGWLTRKVKGWQLDLVEAAADIFAETGKVDYEDTKIETKTTQSGGEVRTETGKEITAHDKQETKRTLFEDYLTKTNEDWHRHLDDVKKTTGDYRSKTTKNTSSSTSTAQESRSTATSQKDAAATADKQRQLQNQSVTETIQISQNWTISKPVLQATVQSGDAEVSRSPFLQDPDELVPNPASVPASTSPTTTQAGTP